MRVSVIGVALIASLSGFGAVSAPVQNLQVFKRPVSEREVQQVEIKIQQTLGMVFKKKKALIESQSLGQSSGVGSLCLTRRAV